jgi:hypothetical protein
VFYVKKEGESPSLNRGVFYIFDGAKTGNFFTTMVEISFIQFIKILEINSLP